MSTPIHHPDDATLLAWGAGTLAEPLAAVIAAHLAMCPACRDAARALPAIGRVLAEPASGSEPEPSPAAAAAVPIGTPSGPFPPVPAGLPRLVVDGETRRWRWLVPGVREIRLPLSPGVPGDLRLLHIAPGLRMPDHGHGGAELTLVLAGALTDATGTYRRGDIQDLDDQVEHQPVIDAELGCVCLIARERPARFKSRLARLLQPWTGL